MLSIEEKLTSNILIQNTPRVHHAQIANKLVLHGKGDKSKPKKYIAIKLDIKNSHSLEILVNGWMNFEESPISLPRSLVKWLT